MCTSVLFALSLLLLLLQGQVMAAETPRTPPLQLVQTDDTLAINQLIVRGDGFLARHDVAAARLFYELAANQGHAQAAAKLGMTYDPFYLRLLGVRGYAGNAQSALDWYGKAANRGDLDATVRLDRLQAQLARASPVQPAAGSPSTTTAAKSLLKAPPAWDRADIRVQLAAAKTEHAALVEAVRLRVNFPGLLGDKELLVEHINSSGAHEATFGVWSAPLTDKLAADQLCAALHAKSQDCFVVP